MPDESYVRRMFHDVKYRNYRTNCCSTVTRLDLVYSKGTE